MTTLERAEAEASLLKKGFVQNRGKHNAFCVASRRQADGYRHTHVSW